MVTKKNCGVTSFKLAQYPLIFGIMDTFNISQLVNERVPKNGPHVRLQSGDVFKIMCIYYLSGDMPRGLNSIQKFAGSLPANRITTESSSDVTPYELINRDVCGDLLDRIADYGPSRFSSELISSVIDRDSVTTAYLDSASYQAHGMPQYQKVEQPEIGQLEEETSPNLKVLVGDSAFASAASVHAYHKAGIEFVTRLPDSGVKQALADVRAGKIQLQSLELPVLEWEKEETKPERIEFAWLEPTVLKTKDQKEVPVQRILFVAESMRKKKTAILQATAEQELQEVQAALTKLRTSSYSCKPDAMKALENIQRQCKLVSISEPIYNEVMGYAKAGRPKANAKKTVVAVEVIADAAINEVALETAINNELYYVVATTNMQAKHTIAQALQMYQTYHGEAHIERQWQDSKATGTFFESIFVKTPERVKALLSLITVALFLSRILMMHTHTS